MSTHEFTSPLQFCPGFREVRDEYQNTAALLLGFGTSTNRVATALADSRFMDFNLENSAATGDNRGMYLRLYLSGGGGGEALRVFTTVSDTTAGTAHGGHISLNFGSTGKITGLGAAVRGTLHIPNQAMSGGGTYSAIQAEIYSDGANSDPAGMTALSAIRVVNDGHANGVADVDDDIFLLDLSGFTAGAGNMIGAVGDEPTWATNKTYKIRIRLPNGTTGYLVAVID